MDGIPKWLIILVLIVGGLYLLDRLGLWMERKGWIYYRRAREGGGAGTLGNAFLELQSLAEPEKRYVLEQQRREQTEEEPSGDPPDPGPA